MNIPPELLVHTVTVATYQGTGAQGDSYAGAVQRACFADHRRRRVIDADGNTVLSELTLILAPGEGATFTPGSAVTHNGTDTVVIASHELDDGGMGAPQHTEVTCQ